MSGHHICQKCGHDRRWHMGMARVVVTKDKKGEERRAVVWSNHWQHHPCADLAYGFEVGTRAALDWSWHELVPQEAKQQELFG